MSGTNHEPCKLRKFAESAHRSATNNRNRPGYASDKLRLDAIARLARKALDTSCGGKASPDERPSAAADDAYTLAMLGLQSDRYGLDAEFREAVDNVLAHSNRQTAGAS